MAKTVDRRDIEINLGAMESVMEVLPQFALSPDDWTGWDDEWPDMMARLHWLLELADWSELDGTQARRLDAVLTSLAEQLPLVERLRLSVPPAVRARLRVKQP